MESTLGTSYKLVNNGSSMTYASVGKYRVTRYADDFLIFAQSKEDIENVSNILKPYLDDRGLILSDEKTQITHLSKGFNFLGFNFRQYPDSISRIKPSTDSLMKFKEEVDYICKTSYGNNVRYLIDRLQPLISGTANYWRYAVSTGYELSDMDRYLWNKIYNFLRRLHANKNWEWIKNRYFQSYDDGVHHSNWVLTDPISGKILDKMSWYKPRRYIMIKHDFSPYDGDKQDYFKNRYSKIYISTR